MLHPCYPREPRIPAPSDRGVVDLPLRLVIGYGNTIRQDDGVGYRIAEFLTDHPPTLSFCTFKAIAVHQLTPDLAIEVAQATEVIFVDMVPMDMVPMDRVPLDRGVAASGSEPSVQLHRLTPLDQTTVRHLNDPHLSDPHGILQLSDRLFGGNPQGYWLLIPGESWEMGDELSPLAQRGLAQAVAILQKPLISS